MQPRSVGIAVFLCQIRRVEESHCYKIGKRQRRRIRDNIQCAIGFRDVCKEMYTVFVFEIICVLGGFVGEQRGIDRVIRICFPRRIEVACKDILPYVDT